MYFVLVVSENWMELYKVCLTCQFSLALVCIVSSNILFPTNELIGFCYPYYFLLDWIQFQLQVRLGWNQTEFSNQIICLVSSNILFTTDWTFLVELVSIIMLIYISTLLYTCLPTTGLTCMFSHATSRGNLPLLDIAPAPAAATDPISRLSRWFLCCQYIVLHQKYQEITRAEIKILILQIIINVNRS